MSVHTKATLKECIAERPGMNLVNVKFFRGDRDMLSADELRAEVCRANQERVSKAVKATQQAPKSDVKKINVRDWVAAL